MAEPGLVTVKYIFGYKLFINKIVLIFGIYNSNKDKNVNDCYFEIP